jgi:hypothetical protein
VSLAAAALNEQDRSFHNQSDSLSSASGGKADAKAKILHGAGEIGFTQKCIKDATG